MADPRICNLARTLVHYCTEVKPGDVLSIRAPSLAMPLVREVYREALRAGAIAYYIPTMADLADIFFAEANEQQLTTVSRVEEITRLEMDVLIHIGADANTRALASADPAKQAKLSKTHADLFEKYMQRTATRELRWVYTLFPTQAHAQDADMSLEEFESFVYGATYSDGDDAVAAWQAFHDAQQGVVDWLEGKKHIEVKGPNVDLTLSVEGRPFINSSGKENMPCGEVFTSPLEKSANGWIRFSYPAIYRMREVEGIELRFKDGKVVEASAEKNGEFLRQMLDTDAGSRYLGEFAIGTNKRIDRFIKDILFDEKIGGTIHLALGMGFPECNSENKSSIHWDMICDMRQGGQIFADGELFYESGEFKL
jgi:aminopeptidase